jgi:hypothetical protein
VMNEPTIPDPPASNIFKLFSLVAPGVHTHLVARRNLPPSNSLPV